MSFDVSPPAAPSALSAARPGPYRILDSWRGIASLAVVAFHWSEIARRNAPQLKGNLFYQALDYGFLGVQIFFVISGFVIASTACAALQKQKAAGTSVGALIRGYGTARVRRIFPTYWAGLVLALLFSFAATKLAQAGRIQDNIYTHFDSAHISPGLMAVNVFLLNIPLQMPLFLPVAWTLCYEAAFYLIIGAALVFAAWWIGRRKESASVGVFTLLNLLHGVTLLCLGWLLAAPRQVVFPFELWPQFGVGVLVYDLLTPSSMPSRKKGVWVALWATLVLMAAFVIFRNVDVGGMSQAARLTYPTSGVFALILLYLHRFDGSLMQNRVVRGLGFLGLFSYSLYLTHTIVLRVAGQLLQKLHLFPNVHLVAFVLIILICLGSAYGFFLLFEKPLLSRRKIREEPVP